MRQDEVSILNHTLECFSRGQYTVNGKAVSLKLTEQQAKECYVYLPDEVHSIMLSEDYRPLKTTRPMTVGCHNEDTYSAAIRLAKEKSPAEGDRPEQVLVLNFANPVNPGGGVRRGSRAQEEDLCRRSSLLLSLEGEPAQRYYAYNRSLGTYMGSHAIILTPNAEIIKAPNGELLEESVIVSVLTCAAPMITCGMEGLTPEQYIDMFYTRICGILKCAAYWGYDTLVLGAFGCGAFGNDAALISQLFYKAMKEFNCQDRKAESFFRQVEFAVLSRSPSAYNFKQFHKYFGNYYPKAPGIPLQDRIRGCLIGGGAGDALGYEIEFMREPSIFYQYGTKGITSYALNPRTGKALISDDTQMTLFTANGMLVSDSLAYADGLCRKPEVTIQKAYEDWLQTQLRTFSRRDTKDSVSWLMDVPELFHRRAPGNTCLSGLTFRMEAAPVEDYIANPINNSKGCGGVMRVAPLALRKWESIEALDMAAAQAAAITHTHSLGYMPCAVFCHIINRILFPTAEVMSLDQIVEEAVLTTEKLFQGDPYLPALRDIMDRAVLLSRNNDSDLDNIHKLGEGWIAEEALAIAVYCVLKYPNDFSQGIIAAVNHNGDSDSTGAIAGNILGAIVGYEAMEEKWKKDLECADVMLELGDDLYYGYASGTFSPLKIEGWQTKYVKMHRLPSGDTPVFFWHEDEENGYLCNWYPSVFVADNLYFHNMEQYLMFQKAILFGDEASAEAILHTEDPETCKQLGRKVSPFDNDIWEANRCRVLKNGLMEKFQQNGALRTMLLSTGNRLIVEASPYDDIFGIGLTAAEAATMPPESWPGRNLLGKVLMEVRAALL